MPDAEELRDDREASAFGKPGDMLYAVIGALAVMIAVAAAAPAAGHAGDKMPSPAAVGAHRPSPVSFP